DSAPQLDTRALHDALPISQRIQLGLEQRACASDRRETRDAMRGGLGTVRGTESVVDVDIAQCRHLARQGFVVLLFAGVDAAVLQDRKSTRLNSSHVKISYA